MYRGYGKLIFRSSLFASQDRTNQISSHEEEIVGMLHHLGGVLLADAFSYILQI